MNFKEFELGLANLWTANTAPASSRNSTDSKEGKELRQNTNKGSGRANTGRGDTSKPMLRTESSYPVDLPCTPSHIADLSKATVQRNFSSKLNSETATPRTMIEMKRAAYTYDEVEDYYVHLGGDESDGTPWRCPKLDTILPILGYAKMYSLREDLLHDVIAGFSVACLHLPMGLAYGLLANLTPLSGVYTSLFSVMIYVVFGTVPHMSMGTNAVLALIVASMVEREADRALGKSTDEVYKATNPTTASTTSIGTSDPLLTLKTTSQQLITTHTPLSDYESEERMNFKLGVAMTSTFECGLILLVMGLLRMGFLTNYMPSPFVGGFTSAAALHIAVSQIQHVLHVKLPVRVGFGKLIRTLIDITERLPQTNLPDTMVCLVSGVVLIFMERVLGPIFETRLRVKLPSNMLLVIIACLVSYLTDLRRSWGISVVGPISASLPLPHLPLLDTAVITGVLYDSLVQAVIVFTMSISMAMLMEKIHGYELDANRELIAYGMCNLGTSFFPVQSSSVSPARTMLLSNSGARTTFNGVPTVVFLLCSASFLAGMFEALPLATLASMILVAVVDVLMQITTVPSILRVSRTDFLVWMSTWLSTAFGDLEYGVCTGVLMAALGFMVNNQYIKGDLLVRSVKEDLLVPGLGRARTRHFDKTRVFYFPSQLFFANAESFKNQLYKHVFDPTETENINSDPSSIASKDIHYLIIDCSAMTYIDIDGINMLKAVVLRYHNAGVQVMLARCPHTTMATLERGDFFSTLPRSMVFHEVLDALARETEVITSVGYIQTSMQRVSTAEFWPTCHASLY